MLSVMQQILESVVGSALPGKNGEFKLTKIKWTPRPKSEVPQVSE